MGAFKLRVALLRNQSRRGDLESFAGSSPRERIRRSCFRPSKKMAGIADFRASRTAPIQRQIAVATDPVEKDAIAVIARRFYEGQGQARRAHRSSTRCTAKIPAILGVVRAAVEYYPETRTRSAR